MWTRRRPIERAIAREQAFECGEVIKIEGYGSRTLLKIVLHSASAVL